MLTGLWVAISPLFLMLQRGDANANVTDVIAGLVTAGSARCAWPLAGWVGL